MLSTHPWLAVGFIMLTSSAFALGSVLSRLYLDAGGGVLTLNMLRTGAASLCLLAWLAARDVPLRLPAARGRAAVGLGVLVALYSYCLFAAIAAMPVALAIVTFYTWPLMVGAAAWAFGLERLTWHWPLAAIAALAGLALALDVFTATPEIGGSILALFAAVGWAATILMNRGLVGGGDSRPVTLYMMATATVMNALGAMATGGFEGPQGSTGWLAMVGSVLAYCFAAIGTFAAVSVSGAVRTALVMNFEPVASLIFSALILGQLLSPLQVVGALVVVGAVMVARRASAPVR